MIPYNKRNSLAQKENKTIQDWVGKVIYWELFQFDHTNKWYMHNLTSILLNETKTPIDFLTYKIIT